MDETQDKTLDPMSLIASGLQAASDQPVPTVVILFHSDLRRVGHRCDELQAAPEQLTIGRSAPQFEGPDGALAPLDDPCISRQQLSISWDADAEVFSVAPCQGARRKLELWSLDGASVSPDGPLPPGTALSVGDRVVLLLTLGRARRDPDAMGMVGDCEVTRDLRDRIRAVAAAEGTVLVQGESGAGKELVARALHGCSPRARSPLLVVNCAAIPDNLLESTLFGHVKGAFTGADATKEGFFRAAKSGTLFLDEIGELPLALQSKLLRALQERKVCPVGALQEVEVKARVVAASNRDLRQEVVQGRFREDLYYRLSALTIQAPPLRQRRQSVMQLFVSFLQRKGEQHPQLQRLWRAADQHPPPMPLTFARQLISAGWPGNVRQLWNAVEQVAVENLQGQAFTVPPGLGQAIDGAGQAPAPPAAKPAPAPEPRRGDQERPDEATLLAVLQRNEFVQRRAAKELGVSHTTLDRWMQELGLRRPRDIPREELEQVAQQHQNNLVAMAQALRVSPRGLKLRLASVGLQVKD